jgi:cytochrome c-type biogenesis protein CcmH/NrfG
LRALGKEKEARAGLSSNIQDYPEYAETRVLLAELLMKVGDRNAAYAHYRAAVDIDPFNPASQSALADAYSSAGRTALAERHAGYARILLSTAPAPTR